jgi:hypothetical protein
MTPTRISKPSLLAGLKNFFYTEEAPYGLALVRMLFISVALVPMFRRFPRVRELFSSDGAPQQLIEIFSQGTPLPELPASFAAAVYGIMLFALVCAVFGYRTRLALMIGTPLYTYFNLLDAVSTMTKYSVIAVHILVMLTLSHCGAVWSVDAILKRWKDGAAATAVPPRFPVWPARLIQLLFAFVYFGAAITKIQTASFFSGEQMRYWMLSNWNYDNPAGEVLAMSTPLLLASGYITIVWELSFVFLAWRPLGRFFALGVGMLFHMLTWLTLGLYIFPLICTTAYLSFLMERDIVAMRRIVHRLRIPTALLGAPRFALARILESRPAAMPHFLVWIAVAMVVAVASAEFDYRRDLYGYRANNGPMALPTLDRNVALKMINGTGRVREKDKFFSFDIGSRLLGGQLANRRQEFEYGEAIIAQCNVNPPHEDMWVECVLEDEHNRVIDNSGTFVTRDMMFANFNYDTGNKLVPGNYWMVLRSAGTEIARRPFRLTGDPESLPAMAQKMDNLTN